MNTTLQIRPANVETDVPAITEIIHRCSTDTDTPDEIRTWLQRSSPGRYVRHLVCIDPDNTLVGYGHIIHATSSPPGHFYAWIGVNPSLRGQGIGSALWDSLLQELQAQGAAQVACDTLEKDPAGRVFAEHRGFTVERRQFHSILDLAAFDETPYRPLIADLEAGGLHFCTLAELPDDPETLRRYYELNLATVRDIPGEFWNFDEYPQFFNEYIIGARWFRREGQILALEGENFTGFASVSLHLDTGSAYNATTGVIRAYRGRHIGLALKVLAARYARQCGALRVETDNDSLNAPVLAINRAMGYQPQPGKYILLRRFDEGVPPIFE